MTIKTDTETVLETGR